MISVNFVKSFAQAQKSKMDQTVASLHHAITAPCRVFLNSVTNITDCEVGKCWRDQSSVAGLCSFCSSCVSVLKDPRTVRFHPRSRWKSVDNWGREKDTRFSIPTDSICFCRIILVTEKPHVTPVGATRRLLLCRLRFYSKVLMYPVSQKKLWR